MSLEIERIFVVVLDGVGAGALPDADQYGDTDSNTLSNTAEAVGGLKLPAMGGLGLGCITPIKGVPAVSSPMGSYCKMREASPGKDTITGHWEIAGCVLQRPFPTFPNGFPSELISQFEAAIGTSIIGNCAASGTEIIARLGNEHVLTGSPIVYTSADSVFQIAMHEAIIPIERQYEICLAARELLTGPNEVGRVICRPFIGDGGNELVHERLARVRPLGPPILEERPRGPFRRTERRKDFPVTPPPTVLDDLVASGRTVHAIGKIFEIFNGRGISTYDHTTNNSAHIFALQQAAKSNGSNLIFANLEDFDMLYGHRNDPAGLAKALEEWDAALPALIGALRQNDLLIITSDHGNDPTTPSTDHSREYPFLLAYGPNLKRGVNLGIRSTFADIAATIREAFGLPGGANGDSFLGSLLA